MVVLLLLGVMIGCEKNEKKYVGKYIYEVSEPIESGSVERKDKYTLDIKPDNTYTITIKWTYALRPGYEDYSEWFYRYSRYHKKGDSHTHTGTWFVGEEGKKEVIMFAPPELLPGRSAIKKDNKLICTSGNIYTKIE